MDMSSSSDDDGSIPWNFEPAPRADDSVTAARRSMDSVDDELNTLIGAAAAAADDDSEDDDVWNEDVFVVDDDEPPVVQQQQPIVVAVVEGNAGAAVATALANTLGQGVAKVGAAATVEIAQIIDEEESQGSAAAAAVSYDADSSEDDDRGSRQARKKLKTKRRRGTGKRAAAAGKKKAAVQDDSDDDRDYRHKRALSPDAVQGWTPMAPTRLPTAPPPLLIAATPAPPNINTIGRPYPGGEIGFGDSKIVPERYRVEKWPSVIVAATKKRPLTMSTTFEFRYENGSQQYIQQRSQYSEKGGAADVFEIVPATQRFRQGLVEDDDYPRFVMKTFEQRHMEYEKKLKDAEDANDVSRIERLKRKLETHNLIQHKEVRLLTVHRHKVDNVMIPGIAILLAHGSIRVPMIIMQRGIPLNSAWLWSLPMQGQYVERFKRADTIVNQVLSMQEDLMKNGYFYSDLKQQNCIVIPTMLGTGARLVFGDYGGLCLITPPLGKSADELADAYSDSTFCLPERGFAGDVKITSICNSLGLDPSNIANRFQVAQSAVQYLAACLFVSLAYTMANGSNLADQLRWGEAAREQRTKAQWKAVIESVQKRLMDDFATRSPQYAMCEHFAKSLDMNPRNRPGWRIP